MIAALRLAGILRLRRPRCHDLQARLRINDGDAQPRYRRAGPRSGRQGKEAQ
jgi:hypothetical protein